MTKIVCNVEMKQELINNLNSEINNLNSVNNTFYNTYATRDYYYYNTFNNLKNNLINISKVLDNYKNYLTRVIEDIKKDEIELNSKISKIDENKIETF